ncbi:MAG TPA: CoA-binding protein [Gammaproteobacteria bacterium]|nr:CoA-binding protein [Gammaproteobacteria bacterium]
MSFQNPPAAEIKHLLETVRTIAVVGLSPKRDRPSNGVSRGLQHFGYKVVPVNPGQSEVLGEKCYPDLLSVPDGIDLVDVFRAPEHVDEVVDECITRKFPAIWLQEGVVNEAAAERARAAGMLVVMDRCIYKDYLLYLNG